MGDVESQTFIGYLVAEAAPAPSDRGLVLHVALPQSLANEMLVHAGDLGLNPGELTRRALRFLMDEEQRQAEELAKHLPSSRAGRKRR